MPDVTISDLTAGTTLELTDLFESEITGSHSRKQTTADLRGMGLVNVTTSAVQTDVSPDSKTILVTSGGTGTEIINITSPTLDIGGGFNAAYLWTRVNIVLVAQGDSGDVVQIKADGNATVDNLEPYPNLSWSATTSILLDYVGAAVSIVWNGYQWRIDWQFTGDNFSDTHTTQDISIIAASSTEGVGGSARNIRLQGGHDAGSAIGGNVVLAAGSSSDGAPGNVIIEAIPTSNPGVAGAVWSNLGVLTISAG